MSHPRPRYDDSSSKRPRPDRSHDATSPLTFDRWCALNNGEDVAAYLVYLGEFRNKLKNEFAAKRGMETWFLDKYDPEAEFKSLVKREEESRMKTLDAQNRLFALERKALSREIIPGQELPAVELTAYIVNVPANVPRMALERALRAEGATDVHMHYANWPKGEFSQRGIVVFKDDETAKRVVTQGGVSFFLSIDPDGATVGSYSEKDENRVPTKITLMKTIPKQNRPLPIPPNDRDDHDESQAVQIARTLDALRNVPNGIDDVLKTKPAAVSSLDAAVQYLRAVHVCCYWSGAVYRDVGEMLQKSESLFVREEADSTTTPHMNESEREKFYENVDSFALNVTTKFVEEYKLERNHLEEASKAREDIAAQVLEAFVADNIQSKDGSRFQCKLPPYKVFEAEHFVRKHILNMHQHAIRTAQRAALKDLFLEEFKRDKDAPLPKLAKIVEEAIRGVPVDQVALEVALSNSTRSRSSPGRYDRSDGDRHDRGDRGDGDRYDRGDGDRYDRGDGDRYDRGDGDRYDRGDDSRRHSSSGGGSYRNSYSRSERDSYRGGGGRDRDHYSSGPPSASMGGGYPPLLLNGAGPQSMGVPLPFGAVPVMPVRRYRDPDAPQNVEDAAPKTAKLQYRTRVSYADQ